MFLIEKKNIQNNGRSGTWEKTIELLFGGERGERGSVFCLKSQLSYSMIDSSRGEEGESNLVRTSGTPAMSLIIWVKRQNQSKLLEPEMLEPLWQCNRSYFQP